MPDKTKPLKQPFYITRRDGSPLTFAGLWERWKDGLLSCAILTTEAGNATRRLHGRMPLVLDAAGIVAWLSGDAPELADNIDANLRLYPVSLKAGMPLLQHLLREKPSEVHGVMHNWSGRLGSNA